MSVSAEIATRLRKGDSAVRLERLEDGEIVPRFGSTEREPAQGGAPAPVEVLLDSPQGDRPARLDGFPAFLTSPPLHQLEVAFFEYLRRLPEPGARRGYLPRLESGEITILDLRRFILASDEFKTRRVGYGARLGASLTSPVWTRLKTRPTLTVGHQLLTPFRVADWDDRSTADYVDHAYKILVGRPVDPAGLAYYVALSDAEGRKVAAERLSRWAACRGFFVEIA